MYICDKRSHAHTKIEAHILLGRKNWERLLLTTAKMEPKLAKRAPKVANLDPKVELLVPKGVNLDPKVQPK